MNNCPRCAEELGNWPALSRHDSKTEICSACGNNEAFIDFATNLTGLILDLRTWKNQDKAGEINIYHLEQMVAQN